MAFALKLVKLEPSEFSEGYRCVPPPVLTQNYPIVKFNIKLDPEDNITEGDGNNSVDTSVDVSFDWNREIKSEIDTTTDESSASADDTAFYPETAESTPGYSNTIENNAIFRDEHQFQRVLQQFETETCQPFSIGSSTKNTDLATGIEHPDFPRKMTVYKCLRGGKPRNRGKGIRPNQSYLPNDCPAHFRVNWQPGTNVLKITMCELEHNHELTPELLLLGKKHRKNKGRNVRAASDPGTSTDTSLLSMEELTMAQERVNKTLVKAPNTMTKKATKTPKAQPKAAKVSKAQPKAAKVSKARSKAAAKTPRAPPSLVFPAPPIPSTSQTVFPQTSDRTSDQNHENVNPANNVDLLGCISNLLTNVVEVTTCQQPAMEVAAAYLSGVINYIQQ